MAKVIIETQYIPTIAFYAYAKNSDSILVEKFENYQKGGFRNRCHILSSQGRISLSVPLKSGKNKQTPITEVVIDYTERWQKVHLQTMLSCYGKAPFFEHYFPEIELIVLQKHKSLYDLNWALIQQFGKWLGLQSRILETSNFIKRSNENVEIKRNLISPKNNKSKSTLNHLEFMPYIQVFSDSVNFEPNLSILDLLMCKGPEASIYLKDIWKNS